MSTQIKLASIQAPRYTSYPTAPNFSGDIGSQDYADWLAKVPGEKPVSLYFHVPFCQSLCHYCGCHTKATRKQQPIDEYAEVLLRELDLIADLMPASPPAGHIHWGGGTPSTIGSEALGKFAELISKRFGFSEDCEHAIELDPRFVTSAFARDLSDIGFNRVSLGVQDFNPKVQAAIGRIQPYDLVVAVVERLQRAGLDRINFDLMYGLPAQTSDDLLATIDRAVAMQPARIALFGYAHVPWFKKNQRMIDESLLPGPAERLDQAELASDALVAAGYELIGLDHFALPDDPMAIAAREGTLRRNFQGYTADPTDTLIGMGASSIGQLAEGYVQNDPSSANWADAVLAGKPAIRRGFRLDAEDRARRRIIEQLMCSLESEPAAVMQEYGLEPALLDASFEAVTPLIDEGLVEIDGPVVRIPDHARHMMRLVAASFDAYHIASPRKHAPAV